MVAFCHSSPLYALSLPFLTSHISRDSAVLFRRPEVLRSYYECAIKNAIAKSLNKEFLAEVIDKMSDELHLIYLLYFS
jgi:hypothetical protein